MERPAVGCAICAAGDRQMGERGAGTWELAYRDSDLVAFVRPDTGGVLIAPRAHDGALSMSPDRAGALLAGTRQALLAVRAVYRAPDPTVQPMTGIPGSPGHACYQIQSTRPASGGVAPGQGAELASALRHHLAFRRDPVARATP